FSEALYMADRHAREEVQQRAAMQRKLAEKEKLAKEESLRQLAQKAREARSRSAAPRRSPSVEASRSPSPARSTSRSPSRSPPTHRRRRSVSRSRSVSEGEDSEAEEAARLRERRRREQRREDERKLRQSRMGTERRIQQMAREQNRDISEKVALGLAKPTAAAETMYDSRLFDRSSGLDAGFNEDNPYDKPLFAAQDAISSIYRPSAGGAEEFDEGDAGEEMDKIERNKRFEVLGRAKQGFKGADIQEQREGPVQFEKDTSDPFGIDTMIGEVTGRGGEGAGQKRYGMQEKEDTSRGSKRARVEDDE
ncbi:mRNA splicing protein, partial [Ascosphaera atra]